MRPYSSGGSVSAMVSPTCAAGLRFLASSSADLVGRVLDGLDHQHVARQPQLAGLGVDLGVDVGLGAVARPRRLGDGVLHRGDDDRAVDRLLAGDRVGDLQQLEPVGADGHRSFSFVLGAVPGLAGVARKRVVWGRWIVAAVDCRWASRAAARVSACLPRRSDSAISASVSTSLASAMSSIGSMMSAVSPAVASSRRMRAMLPSAPSNWPRKRLRPSTATAISILTKLLA